MIATPTPSTRLIALLGDPVGHSLSPVFQNAGFAAAGVDGVYVALRAAADEVPGLIRGIARSGGGGNVTVPHKETAFAAVDRHTDAARATGAVNTYWLAEGEVWGDNTDVAGFAAAAGALLGRQLRGARVLLLGAGGAARGVMHALAAEEVAEVVVVNRSAERARALLDRFSTSGMTVTVAADASALHAERFDLMVNSTSLGLHADDALPLDPGAVDAACALDLVYARGGTPWSRACADRGMKAADGREMLLWQGVFAFRRWWPVEAPVEAMRATLAAAAA